jgi:catechol 2,3-dioxygenase-like lactoylglutathione lyase family enzyme
MQIKGLDHLVLTVTDIGRTCEFYEQVLGMEHVVFGEGRHALVVGAQKINLHEAGREFEPKAAAPTPGSADLCFWTQTQLDSVIERLQEAEIVVEQGPVKRTGARGPIISVYLRDPDGNLIEISNYQQEP